LLVVGVFLAETTVFSASASYVFHMCTAVRRTTVYCVLKLTAGV